MILLKLIRDTFLPDRTLGRLTVAGQDFYTLEDAIGEVKIPGKTAIPYGEYDLIINRSARFSARAGHDIFLPLLLNVPNFDGVRIHSGNTPDDTDGCILVGSAIQNDILTGSRLAMRKLMQILEPIRDGSDVSKITIIKKTD